MKENVALLIQNWDYEILQFCGDEYKESEEIMNKGIRTFYRNTPLFFFLYEYWKQSHIPYFDLVLRQNLRKFRGTQIWIRMLLNDLWSDQEARSAGAREINQLPFWPNPDLRR